MIRIFIALILCLFCSCEREAIHCQIADEFMFSYAKQMHDEKGLLLEGFGGAMMDDIKKISLSFVSHKQLDITETRILIIEMAERMIKDMNSSSRLRPYLHNYPATVENVEIDIRFRDINSNSWFSNGLSFCSLVKGKMYFTFIERTNGKFRDRSDVENYSEALKIVKGVENRPSSIMLQ